MLRLNLVPFALGLVLAGPALALEPTTVTVQGIVAVSPENEGELRDLAFRTALEEAVFEVARLFLTPHSLEWNEERVREALGSLAPSFVLTYRVDGAPVRRMSAIDPSVEEYLLTLTATVDATPVRAELRSLGLLRSARDRPSIALRVVTAAGIFSGAAELLTSFEVYIAERLRQEDFVVVEPGLRAVRGPPVRSALDLARRLGADLGLELVVSWTSRDLSERVTGGVAEVRGAARRARDGFEVAHLRFDAPAYHPDSDVAFVRALEAVQIQLAENLLLQLDRNWRAMARDEVAVLLRLSGVSSFTQVEAVRDTLRNVLGAAEASLIRFGPGYAELRIEAPLSPGALQDRLATVRFDGFRLEPVEVRRDRVDLRVAVLEPEAGAEGKSPR